MGSAPSKIQENDKYIKNNKSDNISGNCHEHSEQNKSDSNKIVSGNNENIVDGNVDVEKHNAGNPKESEEEITEGVHQSEGTLISMPNASNNEASNVNLLQDNEKESVGNKKEGGGTEKHEEEKRRQNDDKRERLETLLKERVQNLKRKFKDTEMSPGTVVKAFNDSRTRQHYPSCNKEVFVDSLLEKESKLKATKQKKNERLIRLSELASLRLRHNNPEIADLSDENRATKLGEKLSELYDNEWTDLFEATKSKNAKLEDRSIAEDLRDVLKFCYEECKRGVDVQQDRLKLCLHLGLTEDAKAFPQGLQIQIKEFQKNIPQYSLPYISKMIAKRISGKSKENAVVKLSTKTNKYFESYINLCINIAWHTQLQDPPLNLDFDSDNLDVASFRPYTSTGPTLDYVIWPALLLQEKGTVVAKGVAQFIKAQSETKAKNDTAITDTANSEW